MLGHQRNNRILKGYMKFKLLLAALCFSSLNFAIKTIRMPSVEVLQECFLAAGFDRDKAMEFAPQLANQEIDIDNLENRIGLVLADYNKQLDSPKSPLSSPKEPLLGRSSPNPMSPRGFNNPIYRSRLLAILLKGVPKEILQNMQLNEDKKMKVYPSPL